MSRETHDHAGHLDVERMLAWAHGESGADEAAEVLRHGLACRACGDQLAVLLALADTRVQSLPAIAPRRWGARPHFRSGALAAAAVITLLVGAALMSTWLRSPAAVDPGARSAGPLTAETPPTEDLPPATPVPADVAALATAAPPTQIMLDFLFDPASPVSDRPRARAGLQLIVQGRYDEAVQRLNRLYAADPTDGETATALGIGLYLSGDDGLRVEGLLSQGQALPLDDFSHLAAWYLGNLYLRRGDVEGAIRVLEPLSQFPDDPGTRARALLEQLRGEVR